MSLQLHFHPLSSYCMKALVALYENETAFEPLLLNLGDSAENAAFMALWPLGKMPVLVDTANKRTVGESSIVIEYLDRNYPGKTPLLSKDADAQLRVRFMDRFFDLYLQDNMQRIVGDRLRPAEKKDPFGVEGYRANLRKAYGFAENELAGRTWAAGDAFSMADCAAAPALFYAEKVEPFSKTHPTINAYFEKLKQRPSFARVLKEAEPFMQYFPQE